MVAGLLVSPPACGLAARARAQHAASRPPAQLQWRRSQRRAVRAEAASPPATGGSFKVAKPPPAITLSDAALAHLTKLRDESDGEKIVLRMGVKSGGCSGMSYFMDFASEADVKPDDAVMEYEGGFKLVCDPKSLLYLFGLQLDYSNELIGGGFKFLNPNAESSCGCGKSFGV